MTLENPEWFSLAEESGLAVQTGNTALKRNQGVVDSDFGLWYTINSGIDMNLLHKDGSFIFSQD